MTRRVGLSVYGGVVPGTWVSGLPVFQARYTAMLQEHGLEVVPFYFTKAVGGGGQGALPIGQDARRFYMSPEAARYSLRWPQAASALRDRILRFADAHHLDSLHVVEWCAAGMAVWEAVLASGRPTVFTPTEHAAVCHFAFLLNPCGTACEGPESGEKCSQCTHSLVPFPAPRSLTEPWFSQRHRWFHRAGSFLPRVARRWAVWNLATHLQRPGTALGAREAKARAESARRFLKEVSAVAYQSPHQHRVFERALSERLPTKLPLILPVPRLAEFDGKEVDSADRPVRYLFAARPDFDRGLWFLLEAWSVWLPRASEARLTVYTHEIGPSLRSTVGALNQQGCDVRVQVGVFQPASLKAAHRLAHFVVNPAVWEEPGSATVLEGFFLGTPSIVPSRSGSSDFVREGVNGYVYRFRDIDDLVAALRRSSSSMSAWPALRDAALASAERYLTQSQEHMRLLCACLRGR